MTREKTKTQKNKDFVMNQRYVDDDKKIVVKGNTLIRAKYKSTILEQKILTYAMVNVHDLKNDDEVGGYRYTFPQSALREILGVKKDSKTFYNQLRKTAGNMMGYTIGYENPETKSFQYNNLIIQSRYENGKFSIWFNKGLTKGTILDIKEDFTKLPYLTMMSFKNIYAFRLYELLMSRCYSYGKKEKAVIEEYEMEFGLNELRLSLGVVNSNLKSVSDVLNGVKYPSEEDYEKAVNRSPEKTYKAWGDFKKYVINMAVDEINEKENTNMHIEYTPLSGGRGGKIYAIQFHITIYNDKVDDHLSENLSENLDLPNRELTEDEKLEIVENIYETMMQYGYRIKLKEAKTIAEAGEYNMSVIMQAMNVMHSTENVQTPIGFILDAIKNTYTASKKQLNTLKEKGFIHMTEESSSEDYFVNENGQMEMAEIHDFTLFDMDENDQSYTKDYYAVMKAFGLKDRGPGNEESAFIRRWFKEYGFSTELIVEACNRTLSAIHHPSFPYADGILQKWKKEDVHSMTDIEILDRLHKEETSGQQSKTNAQQGKNNKSKSKNNKNSNKNSSKGTSFSNFEEHDYDMSELEKKLIQQ